MPRFGAGENGSGFIFKMSDGVTQGLLGDFCDCRQRALYRCQGYRTKGINRAIEFGSLFHRLLELWYCGKYATTEAAFNVAVKEWRKRGREIGDQPEAVEQDLHVAGVLFPRYVVHWQKEDGRKKWLELEGVFDQQLEGVRLRGRCDGLYERGGVWLFETKTKSTLVEDNLKRALAFDWQCLFYLLAKEAQTGRTIAGVCYNVIRTPSLRRGQDETEEAFRARLGEDVDKRPEHYFMRYECRYTRKRVAWARAELSEKLALFERWVRLGHGTYRNQASCCSRWQCAFLPVCENGSLSGFEKMRAWRYHELEEGGK